MGSVPADALLETVSTHTTGTDIATQRDGIPPLFFNFNLSAADIVWKEMIKKNPSISPPVFQTKDSNFLQF